MNKPSSRRKKPASNVSSGSELPINTPNSNIFSQENLDSAAITLAVGEIGELSDDEQTARLYLERKVERAFFEAGKALMELRDRPPIVPLNSPYFRGVLSRSLWSEASGDR